VAARHSSHESSKVAALDYAGGQEVPTRILAPRLGTQVFLGDGLVEIHVGSEIWRTVAT